MTLPNYQIQQQSLTPEEIVDVVPELEKSNRDIQRSEEAYLRELELNNERSLRNYEKNWEGLGTLSKTIQNLVQQKQDKFRQDRAAVLAYKMATEGVGPELEEVFRGDRELLFEDSLKAEEFATNLKRQVTVSQPTSLEICLNGNNILLVKSGQEKKLKITTNIDLKH